MAVMELHRTRVNASVKCTSQHLFLGDQPLPNHNNSTRGLNHTAADLDGSFVAHDDAVVVICGQLVQSHDRAPVNRPVLRLEVANEVGHGPGGSKGRPVAAIRAAVLDGLSQVVTDPGVSLWTETVTTAWPFPDYLFAFKVIKSCMNLLRRPLAIYICGKKAVEAVKPRKSVGLERCLLC